MIGSNVISTIINKFSLKKSTFRFIKFNHLCLIFIKVILNGKIYSSNVKNVFT